MRTRKYKPGEIQALICQPLACQKDLVDSAVDYDFSSDIILRHEGRQAPPKLPAPHVDHHLGSDIPCPLQLILPLCSISNEGEDPCLAVDPDDGASVGKLRTVLGE